MGQSEGRQQDGRYTGRSLAQRAPVSRALCRRTKEAKPYGRAFLPCYFPVGVYPGEADMLNDGLPLTLVRLINLTNGGPIQAVQTTSLSQLKGVYFNNIERAVGL